MKKRHYKKLYKQLIAKGMIVSPQPQVLIQTTNIQPDTYRITHRIWRDELQHEGMDSIKRMTLRHAFSIASESTLQQEIIDHMRWEVHKDTLDPLEHVVVQCTMYLLDADAYSNT